jgi:4-alpha-glucanotransferase
MADPLPGIVRAGRAVCGTLEQAERREWWLSNGRGAYAAGTVAGTLTRRYHGLLTAVTRPPLGRALLLAKADATVHDGETRIPLFANRWTSGAVAPGGHVDIESFRLDGRMPVWVFARGALRIEQRIWLEPGIDRVYVAWRLLAGSVAGATPRLDVALLVNCRDHHSVSASGALAPRLHAERDRLGVHHPQGAVVVIRALGGDIAVDPARIEQFDLPAERERGLEDTDNHLQVGRASLELSAERWIGIAAAVDDVPPLDLGEAMQRHQARDRALLAVPCGRGGPLHGAPNWIRQLVLAADGFLIERSLAGGTRGASVIAGYPWFGDWGRDSMIALPGLALACGRTDFARRILDTFAGLEDGGMLPNVFPGDGEKPAYNTVDAALWYIEAWRAYVDVTSDFAGLEAVFPVLERIVRGYREGTRYGIRCDPDDGLVSAGEPGVQLTWMDAKAGDWVVTPRHGKPVEINALWYNALVAMVGLARRLARDAQPYDAMAAKAKTGFRRYLRNDGHGLLDVLDGPNGDDNAIRPNQLLAVSLPASPLQPQAQAQVVAVCGRLLLTSYGLRSLAPGQPGYRSRYLGDVLARDGAYHQGTVWGWLLGHYALAEYRLTGDAALARSRLAPIADHLNDAGLGNVSEIFDAEAPHLPRGAPAQAWSVACVLEAWWRIASPP